MRLLVDGLNLALPKGTGVATYTRRLCRIALDQGHEVTALYGRGTPTRGDPTLVEACFVDDMETRRSTARYVWDLIRTLRPVRPVAIPESGRVIRLDRRAQFPEGVLTLNWPHLFFAAAAKFRFTGQFIDVITPDPIDVAHWTYPVPLRVRGARNIYTIHDLVPLRMPYATLDKKKYYWKLVKRISETADHIATDSETSRRDIISILNADPGKVTNASVPVEVPTEYSDTDCSSLTMKLRNFRIEPEKMKSYFQLEPNKFYLFVGAIEPKKNIRRLIDAYAAADVEEPLVVVGRPGWKCEEELRLLATTPRITYLEYLPEADLMTLMRTARALLWPSLYEGFGLPIVEAFLCGTPVLTARGGATEETAGDAAVLVDPRDPRAIRDAIRALSAPESGPLREALADRGRVRAQRFRPEVVGPRLDALWRGEDLGSSRA